MKIEKQSTQMESKIKADVSPDNQRDYYNWKHEYDRVQSLKNSGVPRIIVGTALLSPSLYVVLEKI